MSDKLNALKEKFLDFVDAVRADPKKQLLVVGIGGVVIGVALCKLA